VMAMSATVAASWSVGSATSPAGGLLGWCRRRQWTAYIGAITAAPTLRLRALLSPSERRLLMWKQTDKSPFREVTINYFKWS
jgi:hypothetical protein